MTSGLSPDQLRQRLEGITATDISAICGVNPWKRPIDVWMEKTGRVRPFEGNLKTKWGNLLEPIIREDYEEIHNVRVDVPGTLTHPKYRWWMATPDGIVFPRGSMEPERGLEIKVHGPEALRVLNYGDPGTDEVPLHELFQCVWGMGASGLSRWDEVAFLGGAPFEYIIDRDDEMLGQLAERAEKFIVDYVKTDAPPEADGSDAWDRYLKQRFKKHDDQILLVKDDFTTRLVADLRAARAEFDRCEIRVEELSQKIKTIIGDHAGLTWKDPDGPKSKKGFSSITWRTSKPSVKTDWEYVAGDQRTRAALVVNAHAQTLDEIGALIRPLGASGDAMLDALRSAVVTLTDIAIGKSAEIEATKEVPGPRPFNVPRHWAKTDNAAQQPTTER